MFRLWYLKMLKFLNSYAEETLGAVMLAVMVSVAFLNVIVRYCTNFSFAWSEEVTINLFVWAVLLGSSAVFRDGGHLGMNVLYNLFAPKLRLFFLFIALILSIIFFLTLGWFGLLEVLDEIDIEATSESLGIPVWWYTGATPLLSALVVFRLLQRFWHDLVHKNY